MALKTTKGSSPRHDIDTSQIDDLDEISGDQQQALVWCRTHRKFEWHWIDRVLIIRPISRPLSRSPA